MNTMPELSERSGVTVMTVTPWMPGMGCLEGQNRPV